MSTVQRLAFGELLRRHRLAAGLTQQELAERAGLSVRGISDLERGVRASPHHETARRLAQVLSLDEEQQAELLAGRAPRIAVGVSQHRAEPHETLPQSDRTGGIATPLSSFIGRQAEVAEVLELIRTSRLVTLTGPGGIGKTRLALQVAAALQEQDGRDVVRVELSDLTEPQQVPRAIALALGQPEQVRRSVEAGLVERLQQSEMVVLLDNCEHLLAGCASLANGLLQQCPLLRILATSREPLAIWGETPYRLISLRPEDAARLFVDRGRSVLPSFTLTERNAASVAQLCRRLDGIPLAIELAAAWVHVLSVEEITERLDSALGLLVVGNRAGPQRQQTLRATLDWSYALLSDHEQRVFERLCVFSGGWTIEPAESVCAYDSIDPNEVLERLARLVNASLIIFDRNLSGPTRYRMLDVVRQYAHERHSSRDEVEAMRRRHAAFFMEFAERIAPKLYHADQLTWLDALQREQDNFRAALKYLLECQDGVGALRIAAALAGFWVRRGYVREGRDWLERALAAGPAAPVAIRMNALRGAGSLAAYHHDFASARVVQTEALALARALDDQRSIAISLNSLGYTELSEGNYAAAEELLSAGLEAFRRLEDEVGIGLCLFGLANLAATTGDVTRAAERFAESLSRARAAGDTWRIASCLHGLGHLAWRDGDKVRASALLSESLRGSAELRDQRGTAVTLESMALVVGARDADLAARLFGLASALRSDSGARRREWLDTDYDHGVERARSALGDAAFNAAWAVGRSRSPDTLIEEVLASQAPAVQASSDTLTPREREVARLVTRGLTNRQVADVLVITEGTAALHVKNALGKLGFRSRAQLAAWSTRQTEISSC